MEKLVSRIKNILVSPKSEWEAIKAEQTSAKDIIFEYVAILAAVPTIASVIGMGIVGVSVMGTTIRYSFGYLLVWAVFFYVMSIVTVIAAGAIINALAPTFEAKQDSVQALKIAVYSYTPVWVAGILNIVPLLGLLTLLASLYGIYLLYLGLSPLMEAPPDKALGYTVASIIVMIAVTIVATVLVGVLAGIFVSTGVPNMGQMMGQ